MFAPFLIDVPVNQFAVAELLHNKRIQHFQKHYLPLQITAVPLTFHCHAGNGAAVIRYPVSH
jgi:hypothetical protein